jgi:acetyltransferase
MRNLHRAGFHGALMLVNPHHQELGGMQVHPDVASLPQAPDLAVIATPPGTVPRLVAELGTKAADVIHCRFW